MAPPASYRSAATWGIDATVTPPVLNEPCRTWSSPYISLKLPPPTRPSCTISPCHFCTSATRTYTSYLETNKYSCILLSARYVVAA